MKTKQVLAMVCALASATSVFAQTTITFDDAPITGNDLGNFYPGVTFGVDAQVQDQTLPQFPAHSGTQLLVAANLFDPTISFTFSSPVTSVSFWYISEAGFTGTATTSTGGTINLAEAANADGVNAATESKLNIDTGLSITSVSITDDSGLGTLLGIDDLSFTSTNVSDSTSTLALFGLAAAGLLAIRRKVVTQ